MKNLLGKRTGSRNRTLLSFSAGKTSLELKTDERRNGTI